jgi:predicted Rdx family selenoprotein
VSLQKAAEQKFGIKPKIKTGKNGDMTVFVDGKSVFGYKAEGQMPEINALLMRIEAART